MLNPAPVSRRENRSTRSGKKRSTSPMVTVLPDSENTPIRKLPDTKALYMSVRVLPPKLAPPWLPRTCHRTPMSRRLLVETSTTVAAMSTCLLLMSSLEISLFTPSYSDLVA